METSAGFGMRYGYGYESFEYWRETGRIFYVLLKSLAIRLKNNIKATLY